MAGGSIELRGLTKKFSEIAVDNIDLTVASGEFFSLLGPSGCGKTTTLRLIAGFEQPTSGQILLDEVLDRAAEALAGQLSAGSWTKIHIDPYA